MTGYAIGLFLHFVGLAALFTGYGLEWIVFGLLRTAKSARDARAWLRVYRASLPASGTGLLVLILSGGYLASQAGGMKHAWLAVSLFAILEALVLGFVLILPRVRAIREALPESDGPLPANVAALLQAPVIPLLIRMRVLLALGIVYLMTLKPDTLVGSLLVYGVVTVLGVLVSVGLFAKKTA